MLERGVLYTGIYVWAYSLFLSFLKVNYKYFEIFLIYVIQKKNVCIIFCLVVSIQSELTYFRGCSDATVKTK